MVSFAEVQIDNWKRRYEVTRNPLCVWEAVRICGGLLTGETLPIPDWCLTYLSGVADELTRLSSDFRPKNSVGAEDLIDWTEAPERVPAILGLSRQGWNAFKDANSDERVRRHAVSHWKLVQEGMKSDEAIRIIREGLEDWYWELQFEAKSAEDVVRAAREKLGQIDEVTAEQDQRSARRKLAKGKRVASLPKRTKPPP